MVVTVGAPLYPAVDDDTDPNFGWTVAAAADVGMDDARLEEARAYALTAGGSGVIVRHGRIVKSWGEIDNRLLFMDGSDIKSTTKSIGGIALGLALTDGKLTLEELAQPRLPGFGERPASNIGTGWLDDITIAQLATHTAGFQKNGILNAPNNDKYSPLLDQPGTVFRYSDGGLNWLADILTNVYKQDLETLLIERVWNVLGVSEGSDVEWRSNVNHSLTNAEGIVQRELASGMTINTQSMARVGLLFLRDGKWQDTQVFAPTFDDLVRTPRPEVTALEVAPAPDNNHPRASDNYGVLWWTNAAGELPDVPTDAYWGWGQGDSLIVVIPSLDIVIARAGRIGPAAAGRVWGENEWTADYTVLAPFLNPIVQSVQQ
jgi:CubicO group peptidase (beta-lactamase class C family)